MKQRKNKRSTVSTPLTPLRRKRETKQDKTDQTNKQTNKTEKIVEKKEINVFELRPKLDLVSLESTRENASVEGGILILT